MYENPLSNNNTLSVNFLAVRIDSTTSVGPLLVYQDGAWGYVCDYEFDDGDAQVACRQLGYAVRNSLHLIQRRTLFVSIKWRNAEN